MINDKPETKIKEKMPDRVSNDRLRKNAYAFVVLLGVISLFSDFTHEGARSIYGSFLGLLGISAFIVSFTAGLGEFIGQSLRIVTGIIADRTKRYWTMMILGYAVNLLVIPLLMFVDADIWEVAIILILLERVGKGIRVPAKSALTSFTAPHLGAGRAFALQEALDQLGAFLGPLFVFLVLSLNKGSELEGYHLAFGCLGIFAIMTIVILFVARNKYPNPDGFETATNNQTLKGHGALALYLVAIAFVAIGFVDYPLIAFHIGEASTIDPIYVPLFYSWAMGVDALSALYFGRMFDRHGMIALQSSLTLAMLATPLLFLFDGLVLVIIGLTLWGLGMGAQESILKAVIARIVDKNKRASAYGMFNAFFGLAWFVGSLIVGVLYDYSLTLLVVFALSMEIVALVILGMFARRYSFGRNMES